ncbi:DUF1028 domain-containing protein [Mesorhizobium ciceri]|uniref:Major pilin protein fimA n=1 Tax=Mesorhizobium ciceri biovar biserrulae (strain HAMBI 2942 / LMG 23838 / WSM1271) TaxID=765698 RepID=E8T8J5_MESCW|nr:MULTISPECIES: DUF1028 domain-containing protein [Mesorhizobium]ADV11767.1 protein of unknown function DUF1028 [Mesorhizobium ciceri biovar biserrulae WSM1271]AMX94205.1 fimbrial assembly protein FimA [Mesorhizobium ciceri]AMY01560.1 fimbrial assembly protein FimA [Mesorhizobium ciceri biovar biserrulae]MBZ9719560.1 DUF1028 domain-containing protein [Mesorhizobium sp. AD1-1]MDF3150672.1 DUF1028 domain-containing protein [Mesorhizobium sp. XAP10]
MTFSIVARCGRTGMFGVAVSSSSPAVAARCAYAQAGAGAIASQNVTDPTLGLRGLELLARGASAAEAIAILKRTGAYPEYRQVLAVDAAGATAIHSGPKALGIWAEARADNVACGGNMLAHDGVPQAMVEAFLASEGHLGDRLIATMRAALTAGGEAGPVHSAGMKLVREVAWPVADLRCDWTDDCPIEQLAALWQLYKPQLDAYVTRAINPSDAPSYGVPGDE